MALGRLMRWRLSTAGRSGAGELAMTPTRDQRLEHFNSQIWGQVEGWLGDRMWQIVSVIGTVFERNGVCGHIAEFGVHHGLFLLLLNTLRNDGEECFAIDVFDHQQFNVDHSGSGSLAMFKAHLDNLVAAERDHFRIVQRDTLSLSTAEVSALFGKPGVKLFSIDAGHTPLHAANDLHLAQEVLVPGGIIALDDYMSVHWPGVTEGFYRFMNSGNRRLKPFLYFQNKLFLTTVSEHAATLDQFRGEILAMCAEEYRGGRWKDVEIAAAPCLSFA
jgi:hypothetical protein